MPIIKFSAYNLPLLAYASACLVIIYTCDCRIAHKQSEGPICNNYDTSILIYKHDARGRNVDTNQMSVLQLLCSIVREWIKGAPSLCLILSILLYSSCFTADVV